MRPKALLFLSFVLMLTPSILYWAGPLRRPAMADGDKLAMMPCPVCSGQGQVQGKVCSRCHGRKELQHVVPGPHRPFIFVGHVYAPDQTTVVPEAKVTFDSKAGSWSKQTDEKGCFGADLPPGQYPLTIESPQGNLKTTLDIKPQVSPSPVDLDLRFPTLRQPFVLQK